MISAEVEAFSISTRPNFRSRSRSWMAWSSSRRLARSRSRDASRERHSASQVSRAAAGGAASAHTRPVQVIVEPGGGPDAALEEADDPGVAEDLGRDCGPDASGDQE